MTQGDALLQRALADAEARLRRRGEALQSLVLITKTYVSLSLTERTPICDTLISLVCTVLEARYGAVLLAGTAGAALTVEGVSGVDPSGLTVPEASPLWSRIMDDRLARLVTAQEVVALWPSAPAWMRGGGVAGAIDIRDQPVGLILITERISGQDFHEEDLEFIAASVSIAALALTNADLHCAQSALLADFEQQAKEARRVVKEREEAIKDLDEKLAVIERQRSAIRELSTPILDIWQDVIVLPIVGHIDSARSSEMTERLLTAISTRKARYVILDITGVEVVDSITANHLIRMVQAARLLGALCIMTGVQPAVGETLVRIGLDLSSLAIQRTPQDALRECLRRMGASPSAKR